MRVVWSWPSVSAAAASDSVLPDERLAAAQDGRVAGESVLTRRAQAMKVLAVR